MVRIENNPSCTEEELALLRVLAGKWSAPIVLALAGKTLRHSHLQNELEGISQRVLTQALRTLERYGIVERTVFPVVPPHVEYSLTPLGYSLVEILRSLSEWAREHSKETDAARHRYDAQTSTEHGLFEK